MVFKEPAQKQERRFVSEAQAQPYLLVGYYAPSFLHKDHPVYNVIADIMGQGRSSRLHRILVEEKKLAISTFAYSGLPGSAYDNLFIIGVIPAQGVTIEECLTEVDMIIDQMKKEFVSDRELAGVKKRALRESSERLRSGIGLGIQLASYESLYGDYRALFRELQKTNEVTRRDIRRVMRRSFNKSNRVVGELHTIGG